MLRGPQCFLCASWPFVFLLQRSQIVLLLTKSHFAEPTGRQNTSLCDRKPDGINQVPASSKVHVLPHPPDHSLRSTTAILHIYLEVTLGILPTLLTGVRQICS